MSPERRSAVLIVCEHYVPGFKAGGPLRSVDNLTQWLGCEFDFRVLTRDRDLGDSAPYDGIAVDCWMDRGPAKVFYGSRKNIQPALIDVLRTGDISLVYLNSFFAPITRRFLWGRRFGGQSFVPVLLAPRGEFNPGALGLKSCKKSVYIAVFKMMGLGRGVWFHATSTVEAEEVRKLFGRNIQVKVAGNLGPRSILRFTRRSLSKVPGMVRLVFCSRIVPKKNLGFLIEMLKTIKGRIELDIIGPIEDLDYLREIEAQASEMPAGISLKWLGPMPAERIGVAIGVSHFFVLPTMGENYGHAIVEAWAEGVPVIISDRTPWRKLEQQRLGWDIPLESRALWRAILQVAVDMNESDYSILRSATCEHARRLLESPPLEESKDLFSWATQTKRF